MESRVVVRLAGLAVLGALMMSGSRASNQIYRCVKDGQTTLTDKPCVSATTVQPTDPPATSVVPATPTSGAWSGQAQFQAKESGRGDLEEAHTVASIVLTLHPDGKVFTDGLQNGCKLLGLWAPGATSRNASFDISLSGCRYPGLNRRYTGGMVVEPSGMAATIRLEAYTAVTPGQPMRHYDVTATLHR